MRLKLKAEWNKAPASVTSVASPPMSRGEPPTTVFCLFLSACDNLLECVAMAVVESAASEAAATCGSHNFTPKRQATTNRDRPTDRPRPAATSATTASSERKIQFRFPSELEGADKYLEVL